MVRIPLERQSDLKQFLKYVLKTCNLSTEKVEKIQITNKTSSAKYSEQYPDAPIYDEYEIYARTMRTRQANTLK